MGSSVMVQKRLDKDLSDQLDQVLMNLVKLCCNGGAKDKGNLNAAFTGNQGNT